MAADGVVDATLVLNTSREEAIVVWHTTGFITELEDMNFVWATSGPNPEAPGTDKQARAYVIDAVGRIYYMDPATTYGSMRGFDPDSITVNGTLTAGPGATTLPCTGAVGWDTDTLKGAKVHVWDADNPTHAPQKREVVSVAGTTITVDEAFDPVPAEGDRFTIAPVPFKIRLAPLLVGGDTPDMSRKVCSGIGIHALGFGGAYDVSANGNAVWRAGVCRDLADSPTAVSVLDFVPDPGSLTDHVDARFAECRDSGTTLEPYVEHVGAATSFELLSVNLDSRITGTRGIG